MGPMRQDQSWQADDPQAFDISHFQIDWEQEIVICPMGKQSRPWKPSKGPRGKPTLQVSFYRKDCAACGVRERCTRSPTEARGLTLHPKAQHLALQAARERQQTERFKEDYKRRAGIEGTMSQAAFAFGMRRTRYRGLPKPIFIIWPTRWRSISSASCIGSGTSRVRQRASHTSLGLRL